MQPKISLSIGTLQTLYGDRAALDVALACGADAVDFDLCGRFDDREPGNLYQRSDEEVAEYFADIRRHAEELGLTIGQTHGRIKGFLGQKEEDDALVRSGRLDCLATQMLGAPVCVFHNMTSLWVDPSTPRQFMRDTNHDQYHRILPYARQYGIKIATETFGGDFVHQGCDFFGNMPEFIKAYERIRQEDENGDLLTVCMDTGHTNVAHRFGDNPTPGDAIRQLGNRITCLHLHDNNGLSDQHKIPGTGDIDWEDVFSALDEIGYAGTFNLEVVLTHFGKHFEVQEAAFAIKVLRQLLRKHGAG